MLPPYYFYWFRIDNKHIAEPWLDQALMDSAYKRDSGHCKLDRLSRSIYAKLLVGLCDIVVLEKPIHPETFALLNRFSTRRAWFQSYVQHSTSVLRREKRVFVWRDGENGDTRVLKRINKPEFFNAQIVNFVADMNIVFQNNFLEIHASLIFDISYMFSRFISV